MGLVKERQVIVTWYTPQEKIPPEDEFVVCTVNGKCDSMIFKDAVVTLAFCKDEGWYSTEYDFDELEVLAWCDLKPYGGGKVEGQGNMRKV